MDTQSTPPSAGSPSNQGFFTQLENFFDTYLHKKLNLHLPPNVKEWIVKYSPWITLVLLILAIPAVLALLGMTAFLGSVNTMYGGYYGHPVFFFSGGMMLQGIISLIALVMQGLAIPGLFARKLLGWHLVYYSVLVSAIGQLLGGQIIGLIISVAISMYFLFQVREYYK